MHVLQLKLSHRHHSGRLRPHEHTSYVSLALLVLIVAGILVGFSASTFAASPPPQSGSIGLSGTLPTTPPKVAASITVPVNQQHFATSPITVSGTCPTGMLVEIYKNNIFAGSTPCNNNGSYSLSVDLLYGQNSLTAQVYDVLNQAGPVSSPIIVFYDATPPQTASLSSLNFSGAQLLLETDAVYRGTFPGQVLNVPITIIGGIAPYAINVEWGDSSNEIIPRSDNSTFNASHIYKKAGTYKITLQASDSQRQVAFLTVAAIVNGQPSVISANNGSYVSKSSANQLLVLWPLCAIAATLVVGFWIGEQREKHILNARNAAQLKPPLGIAPHPSV
ncbi:MAG: PKD domain-containing protein [Candidatus Saccharimonadales bacterium]